MTHIYRAVLCPGNSSYLVEYEVIAQNGDRYLCAGLNYAVTVGEERGFSPTREGAWQYALQLAKREQERYAVGVEHHRRQLQFEQDSLEAYKAAEVYIRKLLKGQT